MMQNLCEQGYSGNTPLNFGISVFSPFSSVPGCASLFYLQPLLTGRVLGSAGLIIGAELILFLAQHLFGLEDVTFFCPGKNAENPFIKIPVPELQELLGSLRQFSSFENNTVINNLLPRTSSYPITNQTIGSFLTTQPKEVSLVVSLAVYGDYSNVPFSPIVFVILPVFIFRNLRGALPVIILGVLGTIFVRAVVPPESTGAKPSKQEIKENTPFRLNSQELFHFFKQFGKYFNSQ